ncbi:MAG: type II toxin-antitoxin system VapC family toxin [Sulfolobales archaeon]|nr:type II toxin-antitoxin system VapC family toxin [Sulfolobales archaeon]
MSSSVRFLDSNVLVYAVVKPKKNVDERLAKIKERAREILSRIDRGEERVVTTVVHVSEIANVIESSANLTKAIEVVEGVLNSENVTILDVTKEDYMTATLVARERGVSINDALAYVVMMRLGIREIYTFDERHFTSLGVKIV